MLAKCFESFEIERNKCIFKRCDSSTTKLDNCSDMCASRENSTLSLGELASFSRFFNLLKVVDTADKAALQVLLTPLDVSLL